ncbi:hypothetical protein WJ438_20090 [Streptomyces sp. GD-15H]|uniref:hypothetical protein n=1 Tax=Streptomyces sp. GD-15H TaxID=3129112 RepID=UPI0032447688
MPRATVLDPAKGWIDAMLREDLTAPRKKKHTARRIHQRLARDYGFDQASYSTVCFALPFAAKTALAPGSGRRGARSHRWATVGRGGCLVGAERRPGRDCPDFATRSRARRQGGRAPDR